MSRAVQAAIGALAVSLIAGTGVAAARPDLGPAIDTTCNYSQVVSALRAQSPLAAAELDGSATARAALRGFLDSPPDQRQQIAEELENKPEAQPYVDQFAGLVLQVANTCNQY